MVEAFETQLNNGRMRLYMAERWLFCSEVTAWMHLAYRESVPVLSSCRFWWSPTSRQILALAAVAFAFTDPSCSMKD